VLEKISRLIPFGAATMIALLAFNSSSLAAGLSGTLAGNVTQSNNNATFGVEMELYGTVGSIKYPNCGGTLAFVNSLNGTSWYRENITYGNDHCYSGGTIQISRSPFGDPASWNWRWDGAGISVRGVLTGALTTSP
jgi:hypothetical protein